MYSNKIIVESTARKIKMAIRDSFCLSSLLLFCISFLGKPCLFKAVSSIYNESPLSAIEPSGKVSLTLML